jgi:hypothetical protein
MNEMVGTFDAGRSVYIDAPRIQPETVGGTEGPDGPVPRRFSREANTEARETSELEPFWHAQWAAKRGILTHPE